MSFICEGCGDLFTGDGPPLCDDCNPEFARAEKAERERDEARQAAGLREQELMAVASERLKERDAARAEVAALRRAVIRAAGEVARMKVLDGVYPESGNRVDALDREDVLCVVLHLKHGVATLLATEAGATEEVPND